MENSFHREQHQDSLRIYQPQHGLPDVFIWMIAGSKRVAYARFPAERMIYSEEVTERGPLCGQKIDVFLVHPRDEEGADYMACKLEVFLWLGNAKYVGACWASIPPGYTVDHERNVDSFPKYLEYSRFTVWQFLGRWKFRSKVKFQRVPSFRRPGRRL